MKEKKRENEKKGEAGKNGPADLMVVKITLKNTGISRTLVLPGNIDLREFKFIAVRSVGFYGCHLFRYSSPLIYNPFKNNPFLEDFEELEREFDDKVDSLLLEELLPRRGARASLEYDFGDGWDFAFLRMADVKKAAEPFTCRKCTGIDCFEDCGGPWGFRHILDILMRLANGEKLTNGKEQETAGKDDGEESGPDRDSGGRSDDDDEDEEEEEDWEDDGENDVSILKWAFGDDVKLTPEFAKEALSGPTPDEITDRLKNHAAFASMFDDDDDEEGDDDEDDDDGDDPFLI